MNEGLRVTSWGTITLYSEKHINKLDEAIEACKGKVEFVAEDTLRFYNKPDTERFMEALKEPCIYCEEPTLSTSGICISCIKLQRQVIENKVLIEKILEDL